MEIAVSKNGVKADTTAFAVLDPVESLADQTVARDEVASLPHHIGRNTFFLLVGAPESLDEPGASLREGLSLTIPAIIALAHETDHPVSLAARLRRIRFLKI